jgi:riboflavin kinase/FMN adenylyltransferase
MLSVKYISLQTEQSTETSEANILCLGNFDGVHLAHRTLMRTAKQLQAQKMPSARVGVFCFEKPSADFLSDNPPKHITTLEQKLKYFADEGMDFAYVADFSSLKDLPPEAFVKDVLVEQCNCKAVVCGYNYRFGKNGNGTHQLLQQLFTLENAIVEPPVFHNGDTVSSTRIRQLLSIGSIKEANELLTVPYSITARVEHGKGLGRHLGAPTFNQVPPAELLIPSRGVYLTRCKIENQDYYGLTNVGTHPTVDVDASLNLETHLLQFDGNLYQKEICIEFLDYIRPEIRFESKEALQHQIQNDIKFVKEML